MWNLKMESRNWIMKAELEMEPESNRTTLQKGNYKQDVKWSCVKFCRCSGTRKKICSTKGGTALKFRVSEILFPTFSIGNFLEN